MAGKTMAKELFCWDMKSDRLKIFTASSKKGAVRIGLGLDKDLDCIRYFKGIFKDSKLIKDQESNLPVIEAIELALRGKALNREILFDIDGTAFQMMVWKMIARIPFGETRTYGEVAMMVGRPGGARAIGQAMKRNPLPLIFPCHRVVAANGLGGFGGGPEMKRYLLEREKE